MPRHGARASQAQQTRDTRRRILDTARSLFAEQGYSGTSVRLIARELGLSDPAVYYHFPSKHDLYLALLVEPEYGPCPLDRLSLSRESLIDQVLHMFRWWTARPEFGRMLLREQLAGEESSVSFMSSSDESWHDNVTLPLRKFLGSRGDDASAMLFDMLAGIFWDALLSHGDHFSESVDQPYFHRRLRAMVALAIPGGSPRLDS
jgi:AcrR family transcriptional regulator